MNQDCYLCGKSIDDDHASVAIPRLALKVHLSCYERDTSEGHAPSEARPLFPRPGA